MNLSSRKFIFSFLIIIGCLCCFSFCASGDDSNLFSAFYDSVIDMVAPSDPSSTKPRQVVLFEMPGVGLNRAEWDTSQWAANNFQARQPDAVAATFVDRLPYFYGPTFVDSGSQISTFWGNFLNQYVIPTVENPAQTAKAAVARDRLANGTLASTFQSTLLDYDDAVAQFDNKRSDCLTRSDPAICSKRMVTWAEGLKRKWFSLEVARRDIGSAEALIIALQVQDLKNVFADALERYGSSQRIDVGAAGFGESYLLTYLTPSNFWRWWPQNVGLYDYVVQGTAQLKFNYTFAGAVVNVPPTQGNFLWNPPLFTYTPNGVFTGVDRVGFSYVDASNNTIVQFISISVMGSDVLLADTAFATVSSSTSSTSSASVRSSSYDTTYSASSSSGSSSSSNSGWWWWRTSGSSSYSSSNSFSASSSFSSASSFSSGSSCTLTFDLARVNIQRPWLDTSLLTYSPVAVRGVGKGAWSDGLPLPAKNTDFQFKLLPVAFLVSRNIVISNSNWGSKVSAIQSIQGSSSSSNYASNSQQASVGPWFIGNSRSSSNYNAGSSGSSYRENSSFQASSTSSAGSLSIQGPQVIGWVCTPVPAFPNASEDDVAAFEKAQLDKFYRQLAADKGVPAKTLLS